MAETAARSIRRRTDGDDGAAMEHERTLLVFDLVGEYCGLEVNLEGDSPCPAKNNQGAQCPA